MRNLYMEFKHTPECDYISCEAFGLKDYPIPISTSNHLLLNLANLKDSPQRVSCQFLADDIGLIRSAEEIAPTAAMLAESLVRIKARENSCDSPESKDIEVLETDEFACCRINLHPAFVGADDWMWLDEVPNEPSSSSSSSKRESNEDAESVPMDREPILGAKRDP